MTTTDHEQPRSDMSTSARSRIGPPVILGGVGAAALALVAVRNPNVSGSYGYCPFKAVTGWDCPFCGGLRGTYALLHGDVATALDHNVLLPLLLAGLGVLGWRSLRGGLPRWTGQSRGARVWLVAVVALLLVFWVARNLPAFSYLGSSA